MSPRFTHPGSFVVRGGIVATGRLGRALFTCCGDSYERCPGRPVMHTRSMTRSAIELYADPAEPFHMLARSATLIRRPIKARVGGLWTRRIDGGSPDVELTLTAELDRYARMYRAAHSELGIRERGPRNAGNARSRAILSRRFGHVSSLSCAGRNVWTVRDV